MTVVSTFGAWRLGADVRISIDVTETLATGKWTGIERVVRRISEELARVSQNGGPRIRLVAAVAGQFHALSDTGIARFRNPAAAWADASHSLALRRLAALLSLFPTLYVAAQAIHKQRKLNPVLRKFTSDTLADFCPGDIVLLLDSYWAGVSSISAAARARRQGAKVISAVYDLIPVTHPEFMTPLLALAFPRQMLRAMKISDGAIAISRQSALELRGFLGRRLPNLAIRWFHLGNDPAAAPPARPQAADHMRYSVVGTIEPRKGHDTILNAFEQLWAAGSRSTLTIVGRMGWAGPEMRTRLSQHAELGRRLSVVHDASDTELADILGRTDAVIMASTVEGFGLPIVEALAADIPVIASDIAIFREIGGESILYFEAGNSHALADAVTVFEAAPAEHRARAKAFQWPSWRDAAGQVLKIVAEIVAGRPRLDATR